LDEPELPEEPAPEPELELPDDPEPELDAAAGFSAGVDDSFFSFVSLLASEDPVEAAGFSPDLSPGRSPDVSDVDFDFFP
jgi:hypothetical protein